MITHQSKINRRKLRKQKTSVETNEKSISSISKTIGAYNTANWDTSYSWGNHATVGYLTTVNISDINASGTASATTYLRGDSTWSEISSLNNLEIKGHSYADEEIDDGNSSTAETINWTTGNFHKSTMTGNCTYTFTAPTGPTTLILKLVQDATGSRTATWPATVKWSEGTAPTLTTNANAVDILSFYFDGVNYHGGFLPDSK